MTELNALLSVALLAVLALLIYGPWKNLMVEMARQRLFEIRDDIFDLALEGELSVDDPAYQKLRDVFNGLIRFQHGLSWMRLVAMRLADKRTKRAPVDLLDLGSLNEEMQNMLRGKLRDAGIITIVFMVLRSPLLMLLTPLLLSAAVLYAMLIRQRATFTGLNGIIVQQVEDDVLHYGPLLKV